MKIKIGGMIFDSDQEPIAILFSDSEKEMFRSNLESANMFVVTPKFVEKKNSLTG